jgi:tetratricopeptide (TPR) repeat protein
VSQDIEGRIAALAPLLQGDERAFDRGAEALRAFDLDHPQDAFVQYLIGGAYDSCGREALAMAHYERVFALGVDALPPHRRPELHVQAGSTLRNLGLFERARDVFAMGIAKYPDYGALRVFAAMLETSAGDDAAAARHLYAFALMREDGSIDRFRRSLTWYIGEILKQPGGADA